MPRLMILKCYKEANTNVCALVLLVLSVKLVLLVFQGREYQAVVELR